MNSISACDPFCDDISLSGGEACKEKKKLVTYFVVKKPQEI